MFSFSFEGMEITEPYKLHAGKVFAILFSILGGLIVNPILYLIIKYEKEKHYRTLINQLLSVLIYNVIVLSVVIQCIQLYRYSVGSLHWIFCSLDVLLRPITTMLDFLLLDAICLVRYIFIFHLKNPNAMQDDFWKQFIVIWVIGFSFLINFTYYLLPGSYPNFYYLCLGAIPKNHDYKNVKTNGPLILLLLVTMLLHIFAALRYQVYKYKEKYFVSNQITVQQRMFCLHVDKTSIANFTTNISGVIYLLMISYVPNKINVTNPIEFNTYPEYLWLYAFDLCLSPINGIFSIMVLMYKTPQLINYCQREMSEILKIS